MDCQEAIQAIDDLVFAKAGRRLNQHEKIVIEAAWEDKEYKEIAETFSYSVDRLQRDVGRKLWILLTGVLGNGEKVTKKRLRSILERRIAPNSLLSLTPSQPNPTNTSAISISGGQPPQVYTFFGREAELTQLKQVIVNNRCLVLYGAPGIGKSALAAKLIKDISEKLQPEFDCLIWRSVHYGPMLDRLLTDLLKVLDVPAIQEQQLPESRQELTTLLIEALSMRRCLLVLDAAEVWLRKDRNSSFNPYNEQYSEYGIFFRRLMEEKHASCIVLTSREPFKDLMKLQRSGRPGYSLKLEGLDLKAAKKILQERGLTDEHRWEELLEPYLGNPVAIKLVASRIEEFFVGSVAKFLNYKTALISEIFREILAQHCQPKRLTNLEKQILLYLAEKIIDTPGAIGFNQMFEELQVRTKNTLSLSGLIEAIEALNDRSLILASKDKETKELFFKLPPLVKRYVLKEEQVGLLSTAHQLLSSPEPSENFAV